MASDNTVNVEITASVAGLKSGLSQAEKGIKGFGASATNMTNKTNKMAGAVKVNAVPAMTSFSQVIQDAPYGIRGVANNIQQLTSQFGYLSVKTGGAKSALKAMLGSLVGPAGILFAVSAVTSLLVSYGGEIADFIKGTDGAKAATEKLTTQIDSLAVSLDNLKLKAKLAAIFGGDVLKLDAKELANLKEKKKLQEQQLEIAKNAFYIAEQAAKETGLLSLPSVSASERENLIKLRDAHTSLQSEILKTDIAIANLEESLSTGKGAEISTNKIKAFKGTVVKELQTLKSGITPIVNELNGVILNSLPTATAISDKLAGWLLALQDFNKEASLLIQGSITNTFAALGESIGEAIAQGTNVFAAAGQAILMGIGGFLSDLGKLMIKYGVAALAYSIASKALLNPLTAAPAAGALIAAGTVLTIIGGAIKSSVGNSGAGQTSDYSSGASSTNYGSSTSYGSSGGGGGTYVFEIAGTKLIGVLKNTLDRNRSLGGSNNLIFG